MVSTPVSRLITPFSTTHLVVSAITIVRFKLSTFKFPARSWKELADTSGTMEVPSPPGVPECYCRLLSTSEIVIITVGTLPWVKISQ